MLLDLRRSRPAGGSPSPSPRAEPCRVTLIAPAATASRSASAAGSPLARANASAAVIESPAPAGSTARHLRARRAAGALPSSSAMAPPSRARDDDIRRARLGQTLDAGDAPRRRLRCRPSRPRSISSSLIFTRSDARPRGLAQEVALEVARRRPRRSRAGPPPGARRCPRAATSSCRWVPVSTQMPASSAAARVAREEVVHLVAAERAGDSRCHQLLAVRPRAGRACTRRSAAATWDWPAARRRRPPAGGRAPRPSRLPAARTGIAVARRAMPSMRATQKPWPPGWTCSSPASSAACSTVIVSIGAGAKTQTCVLGE